MTLLVAALGLVTAVLTGGGRGGRMRAGEGSLDCARDDMSA